MFRVRPVFDPQKEANERRLFLIQAHLEVFVPIAIGEIKRQGGPTPLQRDRVRGQLLPTKNDQTEQVKDYYAFSNREALIASGGDAFLFGGKEGEAGTYMGQLTWILAVLAFQPGGVTAFGLHFEEQSENGDEQP